jgi:rhodanese-related sulfurtransferase
MRIHFFIVLLILLLSNKSSGQVSDSLKVRSLPPAEFIAAYQKTDRAMMIDVREFFEYKKSRLKDAVNIPSSGHLEASADTIEKTRDLFFYCTSGFRSKRVAKFFSEKGFPGVYSLDGGIMAWRKAGMEVEKKRIRKQDTRHTTHDARITKQEERHTTQDARITKQEERHTTQDARHTTHGTWNTKQEERHTTQDTRHTEHKTRNTTQGE